MNALNTISSSNYSQQADFSRMSRADLEAGFKKASNDMNTALARQYMDALDNFVEAPTLENTKIESGTSEDKIREIVVNHIRAKGTKITTEEQKILTNKDADITRYMAQLTQEAQSKNLDAATQVRVSDITSFERFENARIVEKISNLEKDTVKYPANVLAFAAGISASWLGTPLRLVKNFFKNVHKKIKNGEIKEVIDGALKRCEFDSKDSPVKKRLKEMIMVSIRKAKNAREDKEIRKLQIKNSF